VLVDIDLELDSRPDVLVGDKSITSNAAFDAIYQHFENGQTCEPKPQALTGWKVYRDGVIFCGGGIGGGGGPDDVDRLVSSHVSKMGY